MKNIPVHTLRNQAGAGFEIIHTSEIGTKENDSSLGAHRDDHYIFFVIEYGEASFMIDFTVMHLPEKSVYFVLPGQVHQRISHIDAEGWLIAIETSMIAIEFRNVFETRLLLQQPQQLTVECFREVEALVKLIYQNERSGAGKAFSMQLMQSLLSAFLAITATLYIEQVNNIAAVSRPMLIVHEFKKLLTKNFTRIKSPTAYAELMNISESYLNEVIKKVTGFPVSYWILNEIMLEARRLLYYSQLNVKEIAHKLGYDDHTYFSRLFKKTSLITPVGFREHYRK